MMSLIAKTSVLTAHTVRTLVLYCFQKLLQLAAVLENMDFLIRQLFQNNMVFFTVLMVKAPQPFHEFRIQLFVAIGTALAFLLYLWNHLFQSAKYKVIGIRCAFLFFGQSFTHIINELNRSWNLPFSGNLLPFTE